MKTESIPTDFHVKILNFMATFQQKLFLELKLGI